MSYKLGQIRRQSGTNYLTSLNIDLQDVTNDSTSATSDIIFTDKALSQVFNPDTYYYINFAIAQTNKVQKVTLILKNSSNSSSRAMSEDYTQTISTYTIPAGTGLSNFELIISPTSTYNHLVFQLSRDAEDYTSTTQRSVDVNVLTFATINNIIDTISETRTLNRIGVQGAPGLLMCISGEEIRVGRSGIYEPIKSLPVKFIGFVIKDNEFFALDYQYQEA